MSNFLFVNDDDNIGKIDIDELYEKDKKRNLDQLSIFNKILNRIHKRINTTARTKRLEKHIWYQVPDFLFGQPLYDYRDCIAYLINKLTDNGFSVQFINPNTLFVAWNNWVPQYVRSEFRKKTGKQMNEKGELIIQEEEETYEEPEKQKTQYPSTKEYQPTGNFVYNPDYFEKIQKKLN